MQHLMNSYRNQFYTFFFPHFVKINISLMERVMNHLFFGQKLIFSYKREWQLDIRHYKLV
ncbi:ANM_HP_G0060990.mRNA.1.CDS.1 [Saccharomyces cerevisiae]|nr:ANM_HP_G0060990.mRNA.1.CDS.1 [Saccharomyces cerevisiae]CAI7028884.1 ANM_HP_G0060990.mRNA.1.CDS.1 [Saccharomyces cerevisiae]